MILSIVLIVFLVIELTNVFTLYLAPGSTRANGMGVFKAYEKSKQDPEIHALVSYLVNWVAGTKLIFIVLLIGIVISGNPATKFFSVVALAFSILTFFSRLYPAICRMDKGGQVVPRGYSRTLGIMIAGFIVVFASSAVIFLLFFNRA